MVNRDNYLWVKEFLAYLEDVHGLKSKSFSRYWFHLRYLLLWADMHLLSDVITLKPVFQAFVRELSREDGQPLSDSTKGRILQTARRFYHWARMAYPKNFMKVPAEWIDAMQMPKRAKSSSEHEFVTLDEVLQIINLKVDPGDLVMRRDRAAVAMLFLSGIRASAFVTLPVQAVDLQRHCVYQWPKEYGVRTKNDKKATTYLLPIPELMAVVADWDQFIRSQVAPTAAWYIPTTSKWGEHLLSDEPVGTHRNLALNKRLRQLYKSAGLPYKSAHKFRHGFAVYGLQHARTMADYKAVSMNLMHEDIRTTDSTYAPLLSDEVGTRIAGLISTGDSGCGDGYENYFRNLPDDALAVAMKVASERLAR
jgi:site-specific recombinase XerD